ncbi:MAG TPA: phosphopantetheine-binding protein [Anaeromyxobacter sp.]|nr:phosphopantetheine-binding protein [Anaeromyxobacter sp.]
MEDLELDIKKLIIESLNLEGVTPEGIDAAAPLFNEGLGLDSIDALELAMALRQKYGVRTSSDEAANRKAFSSVKSLAEFVASNRQGQVG